MRAEEVCHSVTDEYEDKLAAVSDCVHVNMFVGGGGCHCDVCTCTCTVKPLYCGHHWDSLNCPDFKRCIT